MDIDTGASYVVDILEFDVNDTAWMAKFIGRTYFTTVVHFITSSADDANYTYVSLDDMNTGRTRKLESKLKRALAQYIES